METIWSYLDMTCTRASGDRGKYVPDAVPDPKWVEVSDAGERLPFENATASAVWREIVRIGSIE